MSLVVQEFTVLAILLYLDSQILLSMKSSPFSHKVEARSMIYRLISVLKNKSSFSKELNTLNQIAVNNGFISRHN